MKWSKVEYFLIYEEKTLYLALKLFQQEGSLQ